ncbi:MAG: cytidine deaminase [Firmicutes bacterium HGW-Firmicutes-14]|nr:MAG: cytidine deaminase [Firmicutes bacterium HGW-Firmicutes-14]
MVKELTKDEITRLVDTAREAREKAYAPYSGFKVGAAVLGYDNKIYTGCNVENVSYGLTNCAERTAVFKAVSEGIREFRAIAIYADTAKYCSPCGACRQVLAEFGPDTIVIQTDNSAGYVINTVEELLPGSFSGGILGRETIE